MSPTRLHPPGHPDRLVSVEEAVEPAYQALVDKMLRNGIDEREIALAVESLAQAHLDMIIANEATEAEIDLVRREAGLPEREPVPPPRREWLAAGAIIWAALLFSAAALAVWGLI